MASSQIGENTTITVGVFIILAGVLISIGVFMGSSAAQGQSITEIQDRISGSEKDIELLRAKYAETNEKFAVTLEGIRGDVKVLLERTRDLKNR
jgi:hypothetical protein